MRAGGGRPGPVRDAGGPPRAAHGFQTSTAVTAILGRQKTAIEAALARERLDAVARRVAAFYQRFDLVLSPTLGLPPPLIGALHPRGLEAFGQEILVRLHLGFLLRVPGLIEASVRRVFAFIPFTPVENVTGQPAMSVPLYWNAAGLPIGVQLAARFGDEATLFRVAAQLNLRDPGPRADRRPLRCRERRAAPGPRPAPP